GRPVGGLATGGCLLVWAAAWWHNYLSLQAVQVRNASLFRQLHALPAAGSCSVYCIHHQFRIPRTIDDLHTWLWSYYECGLAGEPRSIAFNGLPGGRSIPEEAVQKYIAETTIDYALTSIDSGGGQGIVVLRPGPGFRGISTSIRYLALKYFRPHKVEDFLRRVATVQFVPGPWDPDRLQALR